MKLPTIPPGLAGKIVKYRPLSKPITSQDLEDCARSQAWEKIIYCIPPSMAFVKVTRLEIVNAIKTNINQGLFSCGVFIDLKKAFDTVDHNILLDKLNHYGFRGIINDWFSSYLNNRMQSTQIGPYISNKANVSYGIPQGSVLGPLLFLLYVNDIHQCSNKLKFYLFADDTNILYADKNLKYLENMVNIDYETSTNG